MNYFILINNVLVIYFITNANASLINYFKTVGQYFGYYSNGNENIGTNLITSDVPYEVSIEDEKFLSEAAKLTGITSKLDSCQHRVIYKLQTTCNSMNDEEVSKVAVMLLNCQSWVEGRKIYPCSETMNIRDCTKEMDPDAWNSYLLITNRARAVCYSVRQNQFRGLTELTVNKLMNTAKDQLNHLNKITEHQQQLQQLAQDSLKSMNVGYEKIITQQGDIYKAQMYGQLSIEDNINRLADEKRIISEAHKQLTDMTKSVHNKLNDATKQIEQQVDESKGNHKELIKDLEMIQEKAEEIFQKIEKSIELLMTQNQLAQDQYQKTFSQLTEFNETIYYLVSLVDITKRTVDERLTWLTTTLGGTDMAIEKLYAMLWHSTFLIIAMVGCAFFSAYYSIRIAVATFPIINLYLALYKSKFVLSPFELVSSLAAFIVGELVLFSCINTYKRFSNKENPKPFMLTEKDVTSTTSSPTRHVISENDFEELSKYEFKNPPSRLHNGLSSRYSYSQQEKDEFEDENDYGSLTPLRGTRSRSRTPLNLSNGLTRRICGATTRKGTPCKIISMPGRDYCSRHQNGDSVMVS